MAFDAEDVVRVSSQPVWLESEIFIKHPVGLEESKCKGVSQLDWIYSRFPLSPAGC